MHTIIEQFGGYIPAFNKEEKTRHLVQHLLLYAIREDKKLQIDMEISLRTFDILKKPDIVILERNRGDDETHIPSMDINGKMLYIIEVKKYKNLKLPAAPSQNNMNSR